MDDNIVVDPCPICTNTYGVEDRNNVKDCCFNTCAALYGVSSTGATIGKDSPFQQCLNRCTRCSADLIVAAGKNPQVYKLMSPPIWVQDRPFRDCYLSSSKKDKDAALQCCNDQCESSKDPDGCKKNCVIDYYSIYERDNVGEYLQPIQENFTMKKTSTVFYFTIAMIVVYIAFLFMIKK